MVLGSDSDTDVSSDDANPTTSSGLNLPQLRTLPLSPELAAAFDMMMGRRSVRSQSSSEQAEPVPSTSEGQRPILTTQMLQQAIQSRTNFGHELQQSLDRFHEMGFVDDEENKRILAQCNYDFDRALEMIIQRREENNNFS
ncbi:UBA/TS-N domain protein [Trichuris suis]|nr:UBA/TS-N domain protein [Trichuris suis]